MAHKALWPLALASVWLILAGWMLRQTDDPPSASAPDVRFAPVPASDSAPRPPAPRPLIVPEDTVPSVIPGEAPPPRPEAPPVPPPDPPAAPGLRPAPPPKGRRLNPGR